MNPPHIYSIIQTNPKLHNMGDRSISTDEKFISFIQPRCTDRVLVDIKNLTLTIVEKLIHNLSISKFQSHEIHETVVRKVGECIILKARGF